MSDVCKHGRRHCWQCVLDNKIISLEQELEAVKAERDECFHDCKQLIQSTTVLIKANMRLREQLKEVTNLLDRYVKETPSGHSPHMICLVAQEAVEKAQQALSQEVK